MKQKSHFPELISRPLVTRASQENDDAKIQNKIQTAKTKLENLAKKYKEVNNPKGFITDLKVALGIIATALAQFLETGEYVDTTEVAKVNVSPKPTD